MNQPENSQKTPEGSSHQQSHPPQLGDWRAARIH